MSESRHPSQHNLDTNADHRFGGGAFATLAAAQRRVRLLVAVWAALAVAAAAWLIAPAPAMAQGTGYFVTFVARSCPSYDDVFANKARNDFMESLENLGPDSPYNTNGESLVDPSVEGMAPQDACTPLPDWQFTLGHGFQAAASVGPWGSLSAVTDPFSTSIVTKDSTPLYDQYHQRIKGQSIGGATTIELTDAERQQASNASSLWAQGGTPDDPVLADEFPGPTYGFAALRCGTDAVNGDNVEYLYFPAGVTHIFCYTFYVVPPPTSGTITIQKRVVAAPSGANPAFVFTGSVSYNPDGFSLQNGQSDDFFRAGGQTWDATEGKVDNYRVSSVDCNSTTASGGPGLSIETVIGSKVTIDLVANEHVTCVYTNTYQAPRGGLTIEKITRGGVGQFAYTVAPNGGGASRHAVATTEDEGVPAAATPSLAHLNPGKYTITEHSPSSKLGRWKTVKVTCDGAKKTPGEPVNVTVSSSQTTTCVFVNVFIPAGMLSLAKITNGSTGSVNFLIGGRSGLQVEQYHQHAKTTREGVPANAHPDASTDSTAQLPLGRYLITEQATPGENPRNWNLDSVKCNGQVVPFYRGTVVVKLTAAHPRLRCVFTDRFHSEPAPPPPPPTPPTPPGPPPPNPVVPAYSSTDLTLTKQALAPVVAQGQVATFRIRVHNNGPDDAGHVVVADQPVGKAKIVAVHPSAGKCTIGKLIVCRLGTIKAGATVTITVEMIPETTATEFVNRAAVGGTTAEATVTNNVSHTTIRIVHPPSRPIGCSSRLDPVAHAAC